MHPSIVAEPDLSEQAARLKYGTTPEQTRRALPTIVGELPYESREALRWAAIRRRLGARRFEVKYGNQIADQLPALDAELRNAEERVTAALYRRFGHVPEWSLTWLGLIK